MRYEVTTPDGRRFEITAPEGMSPDALAREVETALGIGSQPSREQEAPQPIGVGERIAYGAGDIARGATQYLAETGRLLPPEQTSVGRVLRRNPNLRAVMERGAETAPFPTAEGARPALREREEAYQARRAASGDTGFDWARLAGGIIPSAVATAAFRAPVTLPGAVAQGGVLGAAQGALAPALGDPETPERERGALYGAGFGMVGGGGSQILGRAIAPNVDPNVRILSDAGVRLTPGQAFGGGARTAEERLSGVPFIGGPIQAAQQRGTESFNTAVANRVLAPLGAAVPDNIPVGRDLVDHVSNTVSNAYKDIASGVTPFRLDRQFAADISNAAKQFLTSDTRKELAQVLQRDVLSRIQNFGNSIDGDTYLAITETLGRNAREYSSSLVKKERELGRAFGALRESFDDLLTRTNPDLADQVSAARRAYRNLVPMQAAANASEAGVFTPAQFSTAVQNADTSVRGTAFARGRANMQDLSDPAVLAMGAAPGAAGALDRLAVGALGGAAATGGIPIDQIIAASLVGGGTYSRPVADALVKALTAQRPPAVQAMADVVARSGAPASVPLNMMYNLQDDELYRP
jgi:hypothetical protein